MIYEKNVIDSYEISVVIQGPILGCTQQVVDRVREFLPHSEVILSTFESDKVVSGVDKIIFNSDPGAFVQQKASGTLNNINRQIRSTKAGLDSSTKRYILKIRSDLFISHVGFLFAFGGLDKYVEGYRIFKTKLVTGVLFSRHNYRGVLTPFHLSDWYYFGLSEDVKKFFSSIEEVAEPEFTEYFLRNSKQSPFGSTTFRFSPEQYFTYSCYKKFIGKYEMKDAADVTDDLMLESDKFIVSNFRIVNSKNSGLYSNKYKALRNELNVGNAWYNLWNEFFYISKYRQILGVCDYFFDQTEEYLYENRQYYESKMRLLKHYEKYSIAKGLKRVELGVSLGYVWVMDWIVSCVVNLRDGQKDRKNLKDIIKTNNP